MAILKVTAKCSDMFSATLIDGNKVFSYDGYVPEFMPGEHFGDYVELDIDLETGQIVNWKKPTKKDMAKFLKECKAE